MTYSVLTEGSSERNALQYLLGKINIGGTTIYKPVYVCTDPKASLQKIVANVVERLKILKRMQIADKIILLLDLEDLRRCAGDRASEIKDAFIKKGYMNVEVVIKDKKFENWLISDPEILCNNGKFDGIRNKRKRILPNRADSVDDAEDLLKQCCKDRDYQKGTDDIAICRLLRPEVMGENSRSFRKLLRVLGHPNYLTQSRRPISSG